MHQYPNLYSATQDPFQVSTLFAAAKADGELARLLEASAHVWEGYTVEEHTLMVLNVFERYWARFFSTEDKEFWRLFLLLHDIGKQISVEKYGDKNRQHETTWPVMRDVFRAAKYDESQLCGAEALLDQDILGEYFKDKIELAEAVKSVRKVQQKCQWTAEEALYKIKVFFCCDAGGYTVFAGGSYSLDYLFAVDIEQATMELADDLGKLREHAEYQTLTPLQKYQFLQAAVLVDSTAE